MRESNTSQNSPRVEATGSVGGKPSRIAGIWFVWCLAASVLAIARALPPRIDGPAAIRPRAIDLARDPVPVLALVPGLGPTRAEALVLDRVRHGPPRRHADLLRIHGFGPALLRDLRPHTVLGDGDSSEGLAEAEGDGG